MPYATQPDPYCYSGTSVLKNIPDIREQVALDQFEARVYALRAELPAPRGKLGATHYRAFHRHLFQDVYSWAGRYRTVRISKGNSMFCYPEHIDSQMMKLFENLRAKHYLRDFPPALFARELAAFLAALNAIHPFREGNGRTQLMFAAALGEQARHPMNLEILNPETFLRAMIASFNGEEAPLADVIMKLIKS